MVLSMTIIPERTKVSSVLEDVFMSGSALIWADKTFRGALILTTTKIRATETTESQVFYSAVEISLTKLISSNRSDFLKWCCGGAWRAGPCGWGNREGQKAQQLEQ
jgi:hypothetical protein